MSEDAVSVPPPRGSSVSRALTTHRSRRGAVWEGGRPTAPARQCQETARRLASTSHPQGGCGGHSSVGSAPSADLKKVQAKQSRNSVLAKRPDPGSGQVATVRCTEAAQGPRCSSRPRSAVSLRLRFADDACCRAGPLCASVGDASVQIRSPFLLVHFV